MITMASQITSLTIVLLNHLFKAQIKETPRLRVTGLCEGNSPGTGEFPAERLANAENVSIWWRHHVDIDQEIYNIPILYKSYRKQNSWKIFKKNDL